MLNFIRRGDNDHNSKACPNGKGIINPMPSCSGMASLVWANSFCATVINVAIEKGNGEGYTKEDQPRETPSLARIVPHL